MSENTKEEEKKEPQQGGAAKTTPPPTTSSEDVFQIAVKAEKLLKEIMSSSASSSSLSLLVKQEPSEPSSSAASNTVNTTTATVNSPQPVNLQMSASTPSFGFHGSTAASNPYYVQQHQLHPSQPYYHHPTVLAQSQNNILVTTPQPSSSPGGYYINQPQFFMPTATTPQIVYHPNGGQTIVHHPIYYHPPQTGYFHGVAPPIRPPIVPSHSYQYLGRATTSIGPPPIRQHYNPHQPPPNPYQRPPPNGNSIENGAVYYRKRRFDDNFGSGHQPNSDNYPPIKRYSSGGFEQRSTLFRTSSVAASLGENGRQNSCDTATTETITTTNSRENEPSNKDNNNNDDDEDDDDNDDDEILDGSVVAAANMASDDDLNLVKERELSELKSKPVAEKLNVFLKYYRQFAHSYEQRIHALSDSCTDSLKMQFHALAKHLAEYDGLLGELHAIVVEHEREHVCKNNHRKTKKLFNKSKAFIRYDCSKRLESSIFDYRRLISSQDPYAGMYDLIDMNNHLVNMLPDIGVSIRRYINRCERARSQEEEEDEANNDDYANWHSENSNDSVQNSKSAGNNESNVGATSSNGDGGGGDLLQIPTFNEYIANMNSANDPLNEPMVTPSMSTGSGSAGSRRGQPIRSYESFSKGIDALNRYLLNRIENEPTVDELVQERIVKWINKRQAKYILIFSDVDKLLNQHSAGTDCYPKFHSYLLFNLGKLITVCDSYHQKLKELLYSTTIRRKKKRKKVKLLPEAMSDVFNEIGELKRALDNMKYSIKRCNEAKTAAAKHAAIVMNSTANEPPPI